MKYSALVLHLVGAGLLAWAIAGIATQTSGRMQRLPAPVSELSALPEKEVQDQLASLSALKSIEGLRHRIPEDVGTIGQSLIALSQPGLPGSGGPLIPSREVTLLARSATGSIAFVDGQMVRKGQALSQGGRVLDIQEGSVVVTEQVGRQTLRMPLRDIRVGTLRSDAAQAPRLTTLEHGHTPPEGSARKDAP